jgi:hypothetical protein
VKWKKSEKKAVAFQVLMATILSTIVFWDVELCSLVDTDKRFRGSVSTHHSDVLKRRSISTRTHGVTSQPSCRWKQRTLFADRICSDSRK